MSGFWLGWVVALIGLCCFLYGLWSDLASYGIGLSKRYKRRAARIYADWLEMAYPTLTTREAAAERSQALIAKRPNISEKDREELYFAYLVSEGWHEDGSITS